MVELNEVFVVNFELSRNAITESPKLNHDFLSCLHNIQKPKQVKHRNIVQL